ncbi:glycosyltransferase family 4 protein [Sphingomonas sp. AX6]|uniref:glycosyltransferase family 4 protein n=1 Tax=Sphingomonas sp. AX6 TaxID=2653171 RepID=UPI0012F37D20|nr:glycosyltransferase family 4 protein [Sphingomonas sp. AX6]VXC47596.1 Glycosyltransferase family 1 protein [Sphingomonas sp. AX6]
MTRVAMITSGARTVPNFRGTLIEELVARGAEVLALAPDWDDESRAATRALGAEPIDISLARTGLNPVRDLADTLRMAAVLRSLAPDAMLTYFAKPNTYGMFAGALAGVKRRIAMVEGLGFAFDSTSASGVKARAVAAGAKLLYRQAFARADKILFLNAEDEAVFRESGLVSPDKAVSFGGIGVDLAAFPPTAPVLDPPTFLLMARLLRGKGIVEFAQAAALVKRQHPNARFVLLGDVDANPDSLTRPEVQALVDQDMVEWPGHVSDVRARLAAASVFVLPAWCREGLPRSTQEAAAMAKPVITTDVVGCRDTVVDGVNGFMVPGRDVPALASAMLRFLDDPDLIASMGQASRRLAEERWDGRSKSRQLAALLLPD